MPFGRSSVVFARKVSAFSQVVGGVKFVEKSLGLSKSWKRIQMEARLTAWILATYQLDGRLCRIRVPVLLDLRRKSKNEQTFAEVHFVRRTRGKIFIKILVNPTVEPETMAELLTDAMFGALAQTVLEGEISVSFVGKNGVKILESLMLLLPTAKKAAVTLGYDVA
jgi:hypothetical protein